MYIKRPKLSGVLTPPPPPSSPPPLNPRQGSTMNSLRSLQDLENPTCILQYSKTQSLLKHGHWSVSKTDWINACLSGWKKLNVYKVFTFTLYKVTYNLTYNLFTYTYLPKKLWWLDRVVTETSLHLPAVWWLAVAHAHSQ